MKDRSAGCRYRRSVPERFGTGRNGSRFGVALMGLVTVLLVQMRDGLDQVHVVLVYLLLILGASTSGGRLLAFPLACLGIEELQ